MYLWYSGLDCLYYVRLSVVVGRESIDCQMPGSALLLQGSILLAPDTAPQAAPPALLATNGFSVIPPTMLHRRTTTPPAIQST